MAPFLSDLELLKLGHSHKTPQMIVKESSFNINAKCVLYCRLLGIREKSHLQL